MKRAARGKTKYGVLSSPNIVPLPQGCKWNGPQKWSNLLSPLQMLFSQALQVALSYLLKPLQLQAVMGGNEDGRQRQKEREKRFVYLMFKPVSCSPKGTCIFMRGHMLKSICTTGHNDITLIPILKFHAKTFTQMQL